MNATSMIAKSRAKPTLTISDDPSKSSASRKGTIDIEIDTQTRISKNVLLTKVSEEAHMEAEENVSRPHLHGQFSLQILNPNEISTYASCKPANTAILPRPSRKLTVSYPRNSK